MKGAYFARSSPLEHNDRTLALNRAWPIASVTLERRTRRRHPRDKRRE
jgi:hypothetical protein